MKKVLTIFALLFLLLPTLAAQAFRFALVTDIHISKDPTSIEDLQNSVNQINATPNIDFVLVTGDITEEGDRKSLEIAHDILNQLKVKYYAIPGNHETKWSESGLTAFAHIFGSERFEFEHKGFLFLGFNSGPFIRMADGHVPPQDITWLKEELSKAGKKKPVILATHYPLQDGDVDNWFDVTDAVRPYNIRVILGGHYHSNRFLSYDGIPGILSRSNLRATKKVGGYSVFDITTDSIITYEHNIGVPMREWASLSLSKKYYDLKGATNKYPDYSVNNSFPQVSETWVVRSGIGIYSSPAYYKNKVYVGDEQGVMSCYNVQNGKKLWAFQSGNRIFGTPAVAKDIVVFGSTDKSIYGLNAKSGKLIWQIKAAEPVIGAVTIQNDVAYIGASDHTFRAINIKTGKIVWAYDKVKGYIETRPLVTKSKVIFGAWDNTLYALDKTNGKELWKWTGGLTRMHFSPAAVWPVAADGKVFITDPERAMTAIDIETGKTVWRTKQSVVRETIGLSEDKERVYSKTMNDSIVCFATKGNKPNQLWVSNVGFGYEHAPSMPVEKDGVVFGSTKSGLIFAMEPLTGKVLWKHKTGNSLISTVVPINRHQVLFTATGGEVGLLEWSEKNSGTQD
ncbi:PQQ-binding-like beta-propeller repeat protein [uncultured Bacteroides sp.]|uniref:outer membrane protein assembly factor BamB family protein n=1 Tax=uncultured Bacteroides sp. TaxID=162156 RepID=UPI002AA76F0F|nr:PQQ-binding-like beta-propeller repeat protein [uncultured Bacteroides sp.]